MLPIPQYPLYSALLSLYGAKLVPYYLDEKKNWACEIKHLEETYKKYADEGYRMKAFVVINPGNPTGNVMSEENIVDTIKFCYNHNMVILSDEVYQNNIYTSKKKFYSFRKIATNLPEPYRNVCILSYNSTSKGYYGECGMRGGYCDMYNVPCELKETILNIASLTGNSGIVGQISMDLLINPPTSSNTSLETYQKYNGQVDLNFSNLFEKGKMLSEKLNQIPFFHTNEIEGAMYAFPNIKFPQKIMDEAKEKNLKPDVYYCLNLVENTGIVLVPGSGFEQEPGTWHIRLTNLVSPKEELLKTLGRIEEFNKDFFGEGAQNLKSKF